MREIPLPDEKRCTEVIASNKPAVVFAHRCWKSRLPGKEKCRWHDPDSKIKRLVPRYVLADRVRALKDSVVNEARKGKCRNDSDGVMAHLIADLDDAEAALRGR